MTLTQQLISCLETGHVCGLRTVSEAYSQQCRHYDAFYLIEEAPAKLHALAQECEAVGWERLIVDLLGPEACAKLDADLAAALAAFPPEDEEEVPF